MPGSGNVVVWGTGTPRREFLYVDDLADACIHLMKNYSGDELVNIGTGEDITIAEFARVVAAAVGYSGDISFDTSRPDGTPRKWLDVSRLAKLGWRARTSLEDGIRLAYRGVFDRASLEHDEVGFIYTQNGSALPLFMLSGGAGVDGSCFFRGRV